MRCKDWDSGRVASFKVVGLMFGLVFGLICLGRMMQGSM